MDTRLIFRDLYVVRWSDEAQYAVRIIGFNVRAVREGPGKSGSWLQGRFQAERVLEKSGNTAKRASKKSF